MVSWEDGAVTSVQQCLKWNQADIVFLLITITETRAGSLWCGLGSIVPLCLSFELLKQRGAGLIRCDQCLHCPCDSNVIIQESCAALDVGD